MSWQENLQILDKLTTKEERAICESEIVLDFMKTEVFTRLVKLKDELIEKIMRLRHKKKDGQLILLGYFNLSVPLRSEIDHYHVSNNSNKKGKRKTTNSKHPFYH